MGSISWDDYRVFLAVLETGSLSAAGRRLGLSHPTVRSRIEGLEIALSTVLFTRSLNGLAPTESAQLMREAARTMANASELLIRQASAPFESIGGAVRISVPEIMGTEILPDMLSVLLERHPKLRVELVLSNTTADVLAREVDLAVRTVAPTQQALMTRKVASMAFGLFASKTYLARMGEPKALADLGQHALIGPDRNLADLALVDATGIEGGREALVLRTDSHSAQIAAARAGVGIVGCQLYLGNRDPSLVRVLADLALPNLDVWTVTHENVAQVPRIRAVLDHLAESFRLISQAAG